MNSLLGASTASTGDRGSWWSGPPTSQKRSTGPCYEAAESNGMSEWTFRTRRACGNIALPPTSHKRRPGTREDRRGPQGMERLRSGEAVAGGQAACQGGRTAGRAGPRRRGAAAAPNTSPTDRATRRGPRERACRRRTCARAKLQGERFHAQQFRTFSSDGPAQV